MMQDRDAWKLAYIIRSVVKGQINGNKKIALMFSGGLDSAVLAVTARKNCDLVLYTLGQEDSHDVKWSRECASIMDLPLVNIVPTKMDVARSIERVIKVHNMRNPGWMSTFVAFDIVLENVSEIPVMCGQGADELFGGYMKYQTSKDPESLMEKDVSELLEREYPAYERMASAHGRRLLAPYLDRRIVSFASELPLCLKFGGTENKLVLRNAAEFLGVPGMMAHKKKKAMQYGSGISKAIKKHLKDSGMDMQTLISDIGV